MAMMTSVATPKGTVPMAEVLCGVHRVTAMVAFKCGWVGDHLTTVHQEDLGYRGCLCHSFQRASEAAALESRL